MGFIDDNSALRERQTGYEPAADDPSPDFLTETIPAAFRLENMIGSGLANEAPGDFRYPEGDFNPFDHLEAEDAAHANRYLYADSAAEVQAIRDQIARETADRETLDAAGIPGFVAALGASALDPTVFLPVAGQVKKGQSLLSITSRMALSAGYSTAAQEIGLQATQEARTVEESTLNVAGATFLGGLLGGAVGGLSRVGGRRDGAPARAAPDGADAAGAPDLAAPDLATLGREVETGLTVQEGYTLDAPDIRTAANDLSAARVEIPEADLRAQGLAYIPDAVSDRLRRVDPVMRLKASPIAESRVIAEALAGVNPLLEKNRVRTVREIDANGREVTRQVMGQATATSVDEIVNMKLERRLGANTAKLRDLYAKHLYGRAARPGDATGAGLRNMASAIPGVNAIPSGRLSRQAFNREVARALHNGDAHAVAEVAEAAQWLRQNHFDPIMDELVENGLFGMEYVPADGDGPGRYEPARPQVTNAASYAPIIPKTEAIIANPGRFQEIVFDDLVRARAEAREAEQALWEELKGLEDTGRRLDAEVRSALKARSAGLRKARERQQAAAVREARAGGRAREADGQRVAATRRVDRLEPEAELPPERADYYKALLADVKRGRGPDKPVRLTDFIRANGGIRTDGLGEVINPTEKAHWIRLANNKTGKHWDYVREYLVEEGYLDEGADLSAFSEALARDLNGEPVYRAVDLETVAYDAYVSALGEDMTRLGIEETPEGLAGFIEGAVFERLSRYRQGKLHEAYLRERATLKRLGKAETALMKAETAADDARALAGMLREHSPRLTEEIEAYRASLKRNKASRARTERDMARAGLKGASTDAELKSLAAEIYNRITTETAPLPIEATEAARSQKGAGGRHPGLARFFKQRKMGWDPNLLIDEGFVEADVGAMLRAHAYGTVPDLEFMKAFGTIDSDFMVREVDRGYGRLRAEKEAGFDRASADDAALKRHEKALKELNVRQQEEKKVVEGLWDRARKRYGMPDNPDGLGYRLVDVAKTLNYVALMGGVTISSIPDLSRAVFSHGLGNTMPAAMAAMKRDFDAIKGWDAELKEAGVGWEMVLNTRAMAMADIMDDYGRLSKMERTLHGLQSDFGMVSLMAPWNRALKFVAGVSLQNRMIGAMEDVAAGRGARLDLQELARLGIDEMDAKAMAAQIRKHGKSEAGMRQAHSAAWDGVDAGRLRELFHAALRKEVNRLIVTPGQEKPLLMSQKGFSLLMQFRSYNMAATQRVLMGYAQGLASRDAHAIMALITQIGLGMMVGKIKAEQYGQSTEDWTARKWAAEGIDRSGVLGVLTEVNMASEYMTGYGLSTLAGDRITRYGTRLNAAGAVLGPTAGQAFHVMDVGQDLFQGEVDRDTVHAVRRLMPFNNLFYVRTVFDEMERGVAAALGDDSTAE